MGEIINEGIGPDHRPFFFRYLNNRFTQTKVKIYVAMDQGTILQPVNTIVLVYRLRISKASKSIIHMTVYTMAGSILSGRNNVYIISITG